MVFVERTAARRFPVFTFPSTSQQQHQQHLETTTKRHTDEQQLIPTSKNEHYTSHNKQRTTNNNNRLRGNNDTPGADDGHGVFKKKLGNVSCTHNVASTTAATSGASRRTLCSHLPQGMQARHNHTEDGTKIARPPLGPRSLPRRRKATTHRTTPPSSDFARNDQVLDHRRCNCASDSHDLHGSTCHLRVTDAASHWRPLLNAFAFRRA